MADIKGLRWRVTYTKHLKQKRKVYHDGFLELNASGDKIRLYDESENLIESKFLSKAESVECGKSFTMDSHLVDIADPIDLPSNPTLTPLAPQNGNKRISFQRKQFHKASNLMQNNNKAASKGVPSSNATPSHSLLEEWSVLYTTQLIQKAKKYHDGTLRLSQLGSHAKQVRLYDESERLLESKVVGKEDVLSSGQTLIMQAHIVDIGISALQVGKDNSSVSSLRKSFQKAASTIHTGVDARKEATSVEGSTPAKSSIIKEWNVLYTAQLTRKAKTYHDGILRLAQANGSLTKQITLASEDGQILGSRHLKSFERVESGAEFELPGYLVQVYDLRVSQEGCAGSNQRRPLEQFVKSKTLVKSIPANGRTEKEEVENMSSKGMEKSTKRSAVSNQRSPLEQFVKSKTLVKSIPASADDRTKEQLKNMNTETGSSTGMENSTNSKKCISVARRDACQIMSVLKKPTGVPEREVAQVANKAHLSLHVTQNDDNAHDKDGSAHHGSLTSPSSTETGSKALVEAQIMLKENSSSSSMNNISSGFSAATVSASYEGKCEGVILEKLKVAEERAASIEGSFDDTDNYMDLPSFDLGF